MLTKTIGQLSAATVISDTDLMEIEQSGQSKSSTIALLRTKSGYQLLSATVSTTLTTVTITTTTGVINVIIPAAYMISGATTGASSLVTVTSGTGQTAIIPLYPNGSTITPRMFVGTIYIDSAGNCGFTETIPSVYADMWLNSAGGITCNTTTPIPYTDIYQDTHGGCTTGAGAKYTCKVAGRYKINASSYHPVTANWEAVYKNNSEYMRLMYVQGTIINSGSLELNLAVGDYIDIRPVASLAIAGAATRTLCETWIQITRIGNI